MTTKIPGYTYGAAELQAAPLTLDELGLLKKTVLFTEADRDALRRAGEILEDQVEDVLDVWYGFVGSNEHLVASFAGPGGEPNADYLAAVRRRFGQWILDTCRCDYDQDWLDYQHEIGLRHHRLKKNKTDGVEAAAIVPLRYLIALICPITVTIRPFLEKKGHPAAEVDAMHQAWLKSVVLQVALWSRPYAPDSDY